MNQEIVQVISQYETALNGSDTGAAMKLYGTDPIFMPQHSVALEGRPAVEAGYDFVFKNLKLNVKFTVHEVVEMEELAYVRTTSAGETKILPLDKLVKEGNNELFIFRKENGSWKIHRYLFATTNPPAA